MLSSTVRIANRRNAKHTFRLIMIALLTFSNLTAAEPMHLVNGLYAVCFGTSQFPEKYALKDGTSGRNITISWSFYLWKTTGKTVLFDAGFSDAHLAQQWGVGQYQRPKDLLATVGIGPDDINEIYVTHLHFDHLNGIVDFPRAKVFISSADRKDYINHAELGGMTYDEPVATILRDPQRTTVIDQHLALSPTTTFTVIGGHTAGSSTIALTHAQVNYVITGDECYLCANANAEAARPIGIAFNSMKNVEFLQTISAKDIVKLPCHDPSVFTTYKRTADHIVQIFAE